MRDELINVECSAEFSIELVLAVPYAYWLHLQGKLGKTCSVIDSKPMYYFSTNHEEKYKCRTIDNNAAGLNDLPNNWIHHNPNAINPGPGVLDFTKWIMPPFKTHYANNEYRFNKPILIISNKYSYEWNAPPVNYLDVPTLIRLFELLTGKYTVIYKRPKSYDYISDENESVSIGDITGIYNSKPLNDYSLCKEFGVIDFNDLRKMSGLSYNEFQFRLFANCANFISVQGGNSHICSLFGKKNVNYIVKGKELRPGYFGKNTWYYRMNQCDTIPVTTYSDLINTATETFL